MPLSRMIERRCAITLYAIADCHMLLPLTPCAACHCQHATLIRAITLLRLRCYATPPYALQLLYFTPCHAIIAYAADYYAVTRYAAAIITLHDTPLLMLPCAAAITLRCHAAFHAIAYYFAAAAAAAYATCCRDAMLPLRCHAAPLFFAADADTRYHYAIRHTR